VDIYGGSGRETLRVWADNPNFIGGKWPALQIDAAGGLDTVAPIIVSGHPSTPITPPESPFAFAVAPPTTDPAMLQVWADVAAPAIVVGPDNGTTQGQGNFQNIAFMDGSLNERMAIDGAGTLQWSASIANTFAASAWDTTLARTGPGLLQTQSLRLTGMFQNAVSTFSALPAATAVPNGTQVYCSDCVFGASTAKCASGGKGAMAFLLAGVWSCD
jgi:hypothetical protein